MTDLVVHLGLQKAGSTTIQAFLRHCEFFLGKAPTLQATSLGKRFEQDARRCASHPSWERAVRRWGEHVRAWKRAQGISSPALAVSSEALSSPARFPERAFVDNLRALDERVWREGDVKALLVLRNQAEWLGSRYAQGSLKTIEASQRDFEAYVQRVIDSGQDVLDWSQWVSDLRDALGSNKVCVLLFEDIKLKQFWDALFSFCGGLAHPQYSGSDLGCSCGTGSQREGWCMGRAAIKA